MSKGPIPGAEATKELFEKFFRDYWKLAHPTEGENWVNHEVDSGVRNFEYSQKLGGNYSEGVRWGVRLSPSRVWPHTKVRYKIVDDLTDGPKFVFVIYANSIASKEVHEDVCKALEAIVKTLENEYPVVLER